MKKLICAVAAALTLTGCAVGDTRPSRQVWAEWSAENQCAQVMPERKVHLYGESPTVIRPRITVYLFECKNGLLWSDKGRYGFYDKG